jgi:hypothetical protein
MNQEVLDELPRFLALCQDIVDTHYREKWPKLEPPTLELQILHKNIRIYEPNGGAFCFVDAQNGDVLKPDTYRRPAKHARGSIFSEDTYGLGIEHHGARYLR